METATVLILMFIYNMACGDKINETYQYILSNLDYLETLKDVDNNATKYIIVAAGNLYLLKKTVPHMSDKWKKKIIILAETFQKFQDKELEKVAKPESKIFFEPKYWPLLGSIEDNKFVTGKINERGFLGVPMLSSLKNDQNRSETDECLEDLIETNNISHTPRKCQLKCEKKMYDVNNLSKNPPLIQRLEYISAEIIFNCTNHDPQKIREFFQTYCNAIMSRVSEVMLIDTYSDIKHTFLHLRRAVACGPKGYGEFFDDAILNQILSLILPDGSVSEEDNPETAILTAQTMAYLTSYLRMLLENHYS